MGAELVTILVLVVMFVIATTMPVNLGALALVAAFLVGTLTLGLSTDDIILGVAGEGEISGGFPGDLFLLLVGLTYLFALAQDNGTIDLLVHWSMRLVRGHLAAVPWIFFLLSTGLSAIGALFAVAIVAPLAMPFARRYGINLLLMGMMVVHGALGGAFSPISVYGAFVNETMANNGLPSSPVTLFLTPLIVNIVVGIVIYVALGGRKLVGRRVAVGPGGEEVDDAQAADDATPARPGPGAARATASTEQAAQEQGVVRGPVGYVQVITLVLLAALAIGTVVFDLDVGFLSIVLAVVLRLATYRSYPDAVGKVSWSTVLLICGVITYVGVLQAAGTISYVSGGISSLGAPLLAALLLCYLGGVLSAFASSVGILGVAIPLAVPFLQQGDVSPIGMVAALAVATTIVDVSPFSTNGALILANAPDDVDRDRFYRQMLLYSAIVVALGPLIAWLLLVVPGWL